MNRTELKTWAKEKIKGHIWELLIPMLVAGILTSLTLGASYTFVEGQGFVVQSAGYNVGIFFYFVNAGLAYFMYQFINDKEHGIKDLFRYVNDYVRTFLTGLLGAIFTFLWALLLIVPGIMRAIGYMMAPILLSDEKYNNLSAKQILDKSYEIMNGHKMDYFILELSFIGWFLLIGLTFGLAAIYVIPYVETTTYKFLFDIKEKYEAEQK